MAAANPIYVDVKGAPFRIGDTVKVVAAADETFDNAFLEQKGTVEYLEYSCGCGQTYPSDPMIGVRFGDEVEEFWAEELESDRTDRC